MNNPARQAALDYIDGSKARLQRIELSDRSLARKFECGTSTIRRCKAHSYVHVLTPDEQRLVRQCIREREHLEAREHVSTKPYLAHKYGVSICAINKELEILGFVNPLEARKSREVAA